MTISYGSLINFTTVVSSVFFLLWIVLKLSTFDTPVLLFEFPVLDNLRRLAFALNCFGLFMSNAITTAGVPSISIPGSGR